jgi:hypothetical protein
MAAVQAAFVMMALVGACAVDAAKPSTTGDGSATPVAPAPDAARTVDTAPPDQAKPTTATPAPAPTFTALYQMYFGARTVTTKGLEAPGCQGMASGGCHSIAVRKGDQHSFASKASAYQALVLSGGWVTPGDELSALLFLLEDGRMPKDGPAMKATDIEKVRAWIAEGAKNN